MFRSQCFGFMTLMSEDIHWKGQEGNQDEDETSESDERFDVELEDNEEDEEFYRVICENWIGEK
jgi:hypothetical protein